MAKATRTLPAADDACRSTGRRERVSIDLRGHGAALNALAQSMQMPVSALVRKILGEWMHARTFVDQSNVAGTVPPRSNDAITKVTLRMPARYAVELAYAARAAELSQGIYVVRLLDGQPPAPVALDQHENRLALVRSTAMLAALSSDLHALLRAMRQASLPDAAACKTAVAEVSDAVHLHLVAVAPLMAAIAPSRRAAASDPL